MLHRLTGVAPTNAEPLSWPLMDDSGQAEVQLSLRATRWGRHPVAATWVQLRAPFGLLAWTGAVHTGPTLRVLPGTERLDRLLDPADSRAVWGAHRSRRIGDGHEFAELRPYQAGDRLRDLSWVATARHGRPFVNRHHPDLAGDVVIALDLLDDGSIGGREGLLRAARVAWALASVHLRANDRVGLAGLSGSTRWLPPRAGSLGLPCRSTRPTDRPARGPQPRAGHRPARRPHRGHGAGRARHTGGVRPPARSSGPGRPRGGSMSRPGRLLAASSVALFAAVVVVAVLAGPAAWKSWLAASAGLAIIAALQSVAADPRDLAPALLLSLPPVLGLLADDAPTWLAAIMTPAARARLLAIAPLGGLGLLGALLAVLVARLPVPAAGLALAGAAAIAAVAAHLLFRHPRPGPAGRRAMVESSPAAAPPPQDS
jgi:hypothetical protein